MAASSGISGSPRPAVLGDALGTVPPDRMAIEMASKVGAFFSVVNFMLCINVAKDHGSMVNS
jgi:hypothetical protein